MCEHRCKQKCYPLWSTATESILRVFSWLCRHHVGIGLPVLINTKTGSQYFWHAPLMSKTCMLTCRLTCITILQCYFNKQNNNLSSTSRLTHITKQIVWSMSKTCWEELIKVGWPCCFCIYIYFLCIPKVLLHTNNWFNSTDCWVQSCCFYCLSCKYYRVCQLPRENKQTVCFLFVAQGRWLTRKISAVNVHFCSCFLERSAVFDSWMPIERGHQLLVFSMYLKAEMLYVAVLWPGGSTTLSALPWQ